MHSSITRELQSLAKASWVFARDRGDNPFGDPPPAPTACLRAPARTETEDK